MFNFDAQKEQLTAVQDIGNEFFEALANPDGVTYAQIIDVRARYIEATNVLWADGGLFNSAFLGALVIQT